MENSAEVIIVGGGPAGMSCALVLGRCGRKVLLFDTGNQRNKSSHSMHAFISRDGEDPVAFLRKTKGELKKYGIRSYQQEIISVERSPDGFHLRSAEGNFFFSKKLVLATGLADELPRIAGIEQFYGKSVFHCPYCDGWEARNKKWIVYAIKKQVAVEACLRFRDWTKDITLLSAGIPGFGKKEEEILTRNGIKCINKLPKKLIGKNGRLKKILFEQGEMIDADFLFFSTAPKQQSNLALQLGCDCTNTGAIHFNRKQQTNIPGLYAAGDVVRDMHLVIIAAAEGAKAAVAINTELNKELRVL
jgi:thioredoxin reductase